MNYLRSWISRWDHFWFGPLDRFPLEIFRLVFCVGLALFYSLRFFDFDLFFGETGLLPFGPSHDVIPPLFRAPLQWQAVLSIHPALSLFLHALLIALLLFVGLGFFAGWRARLASVTVFALHMAFVTRNFSIIYGPDLVSTCWLFYLALADHTGEVRFKGKKHHSPTDALTTVAYRLIQVHLCVIYAYSGLEKARGMSWWKGDAIWNALGNGQISSFDLGFLANIPFVVVLMTFVTLIWEVYFPVLVWIRAIRPGILMFGVFLHGLIGLTMGLRFFSTFMLSPYLLFLQPQKLRLFSHQIYSMHQKFFLAAKTKGAYKKIWRKN